MDTDTGNIVLEFIPISAETATQTLLLSKEQQRQCFAKGLSKMGIALAAEQKPLDAWLSYLCRSNGLPDIRPVPRELADAIMDSPAASRFMFAIA